MMKWKKIQLPVTDNDIESLKSGDLCLLSGILYTARDRAHERLCSLARDGKKLPFDPKGQIIYYVGPSPTPPGLPIGSAGPTTSYRMDPFTEEMLQMGIKGMIGKGRRDKNSIKLLKKHKAVYFSSFGGAGAYLGERIIESKVIAFEEFGPEAIYRLKILDFPAIVINDIFGGDLYEDQLSK
jgi:fumarate hydratase subunit beta